MKKCDRCVTETAKIEGLLEKVSFPAEMWKPLIYKEFSWFGSGESLVLNLSGKD